MSRIGNTKTELKNYKRVHFWLRNNFIKPGSCSFCSVKNKMLEWALKKDCIYEKKRENFIILCSGCHRKYDPITEDGRERLRLSASKHKRKPVMVWDKLGNLVGEFPYITLACKELNVRLAAVSNCLSGRSKSAGGYTWQKINKSTNITG